MLGIFSLDRWQEIWSTLVQNKLRTALTMIAMSWGIFMLVALLGLGRGLQHGVTSGFADDAINSIWVFGGQTSIAHEGLPVGRRINFDNRDVALAERDPQIDHLSGRFNIGGGDLRVRAGDKSSSSFEVRAVHPGHLYIEKTIMVMGRFLNDEDVSERRKVCAIGIPVAEFLFGRRDVIGEWLEVNRVSFQVVGVFDDEGGEGELRKVYIPISAAQAAFNGADRVHQIMCTVATTDVEESKAIAERVKERLAEHHKFDPSDPQAARVRNNLENYDRFQKIFTMIDMFIWLMGVCTIVAGVVGISNIMMIIVRERTKEIGIRKALGATPWNIVSTILQEAVVLTAAAGYLGLVAGVAFLELIAKLVPPNDMFDHPEVDLRVAVAATAVLVIAGAIAGFFPARAAAKVNPIVALRDE
jgi:putative ABC transport system permease protein